MKKKADYIKAINDSFMLGDLVNRIPCDVPFCEERRTIQTGAGNLCQKHALALVEKTVKK